MFFALDEDQRAMQTVLRDYLRANFPIRAVHEVYDNEAHDGDPVELWQAVRENGWAAVTVDEQYDGLGLGLLEAALIARCWGEGCVPGSLLITLLATEALRLGASPAQKSEWLPRVAAGQAKLTLTTTGRASFVGNTVTGEATFVEYAHVADLIVVSLSDGRLCLVRPTEPTTEITTQDALDRSTRFCTVRFDHAPAECLPNDVMEELTLRGTVLKANDLAGIARGALTRTVDYVKTRQQFGKLVGSFQAIKHSLADLHVATTMAEHSSLYAAHAVEAAQGDRQFAASVAKAKCNETARDVTAAMIQFHGGIGYTWEHDAHLFFKRAKRGEYQYGNTSFHREQITRTAIAGATYAPTVSQVGQHVSAGRG
jgi:alkylation response protein AidB-like acyl-CoA dehydrogenase